MNTPLVSIACITFNQGKFIKQSIDGFLMQKTNFPIEIIIHDDASTDDTSKIINEYVTKFPDLIFPIFQTENKFSKGINPAFEYVYPKCKGKYIAPCEGDDYWTDPLKLQKQIDFLETHPEYVLCSHDVSIFNQYTRQYSTWIYKNNEYRDVDCIKGTVSHVNSWVFRNNKISTSDMKFLPAGDNPFIVYLLQYGKAKHFNEQMSVYRISNIGTWSTLDELNRSFNRLIFHLWVVKNYKKYFTKLFLTLSDDFYFVSRMSLSQILKKHQTTNIKKFAWSMFRKNFSFYFILIILYSPLFFLYKLTKAS